MKHEGHKVYNRKDTKASGNIGSGKINMDEQEPQDLKLQYNFVSFPFLTW